MSNQYISNAQKKEKQGDLTGALKDYQKALLLDSNNTAIQIEIGNLFAILGNYEQAIFYLKKVFTHFPNNVDLRNGLCFCLCELGNQYHSKRNFRFAEMTFLEAIRYNPFKSEYFFNLGNAYYSQQKYQLALDNYEQSLTLKKDAETVICIGNTLRSLGNYLAAKGMYSNALNINSDLTHAEIELVHLKQNLCDWDNIIVHYENIKKKINTHTKSIISPFTILSMPNMGCEEQLKVSSLWASHYHAQPINLAKKFLKKSKISIGYLSSDFRLHPLYFLIIDVLKNHDEKSFDITLYYSGQDENTQEQNDLKSIGHEFINISDMSDLDAAHLISSNNTDILVDLSGFTKNSRSLLAVYKPARIHINWLGFAGTMGYYNSSPLCDYILADQYTIPEKQREFYAEDIVYLPHCYQPNIENRATLSAITKDKYGFSNDHFIFASFGQTIKITEDQFKLWIRILKDVPRGVLWLLESNDISMKNLLVYAEKSGIDPSRIYFAKKIIFTEHIDRHQVIDLFLDTFPYNAHTSTADALWAHCPVLTKSGETFASRVAGSILTEIGCPELVVDCNEAYYKEAVRYASDQKSLDKVKQKIIIGKEISTLFKPKIFTTELEKIYSRLVLD